MFQQFNLGMEVSDDLHENIVRFASRFVLAIFCLLAVYVSARILIPEDLFSTAIYLDSNGLEKAFNTEASATGDPVFSFIIHTVLGFDFPNVSVAAFAVSLAVFSIQIIAGYLVSISGEYGPRSQTLLALIINRRSVRLQTLNWQKLTFFSFWAICAFFDTATDIAFRSGTDWTQVPEAFLYSLIVYNIFSEWMLFVGMILFLNLAYSASVMVIPIVHGTINIIKDHMNDNNRPSSNKKGRSKKQNSSGYQPRGYPQNLPTVINQPDRKGHDSRTQPPPKRSSQTKRHS